MFATVRGVLSGLIAFAAAGCASTLHGTTQDILFASIPPGVRVAVAEQTATTPVTLTLERRNAYVAIFTMPGFPERQARIERELSEAFYGNLLVGGIIGIAIDMSNGAAYNLIPGGVEMHMGTGIVRDTTKDVKGTAVADAPPAISPAEMTWPTIAARPSAPSPAASPLPRTTGLLDDAPAVQVVNGVVLHPITGAAINCAIMRDFPARGMATGPGSGAANALTNYQIGGRDGALLGLTPAQVAMGLRLAEACRVLEKP